MPGFDRTGPQGAGPMTGGARGYCNPATRATAAGVNTPRGAGYGRGYGRGFGRGYGRGYYPPPAASYDGGPGGEAAIKAETDYLKETLNSINERLAALEKKVSE